MGFQLAGYRKLYAASKRIRVIYRILPEGVVDVVAIGPRDSAKVYAIADAEVKRRRLRRIS